MKASRIIALARNGRPDLAAKNLGHCPPATWSHPLRLMRIIAKHPHSSGAWLSTSYLALCWREGRAQRAS